MNYYSERLRYMKPLLKVFVSILFLMCLLLFALYLGGEWLPSYDLHIAALGICKSQSPLHIEQSVSASTEHLYICGRAEGTTFRNINFLLFRDSSLIYRETYRLEPGEFFFELPLSDLEFTSGTYRIDATIGRLTVAQSASFKIHSP